MNMNKKQVRLAVEIIKDKNNSREKIQGKDLSIDEQKCIGILDQEGVLRPVLGGRYEFVKGNRFEARDDKEIYNYFYNEYVPKSKFWKDYIWKIISAISAIVVIISTIVGMAKIFC